jgi:hypothetical protein
MKKPKLASGFAQKEVDRLETEFDAKAVQMASLTQDAMNEAPVNELEPQTKMTKAKILEADAPKIVPSMTRTANGKKKPEQDAIRKRGWEYIRVIAENVELPGEKIEFWHKPMWAGEDCHFWQIPVNRPIYVPRFVAEHIRSRKYHRLTMQNEMTVETNQFGEMKGKLIATEVRQRLDCRVVGFDS